MFRVTLSHGGLPLLACEVKSFHSAGTGVALKPYGLLVADALYEKFLPHPKGVLGCDIVA